ncbi:MAG: hypothetical protein DMG05_03065 [Acidobacteria bacterium]|nr:MAG: hypothetical protein DMG05_03065 [Acidobacteriota bacterium]
MTHSRVIGLGAAKKFKTGRDREGEAPAEPHGTRIYWGTARQEARPPNFFTAPLVSGENGARGGREQ